MNNIPSKSIWKGCNSIEREIHMVCIATVFLDTKEAYDSILEVLNGIADTYNPLKLLVRNLSMWYNSREGKVWF